MSSGNAEPYLVRAISNEGMILYRGTGGGGGGEGRTPVTTACPESVESKK